MGLQFGAGNAGRQDGPTSIPTGAGGAGLPDSSQVSLNFPGAPGDTAGRGVVPSDPDAPQPHAGVVANWVDTCPVPLPADLREAIAAAVLATVPR